MSRTPLPVPEIRGPAATRSLAPSRRFAALREPGTTPPGDPPARRGREPREKPRRAGFLEPPSAAQPADRPAAA